MTKEQRLQLAHLCRLNQNHNGSEYVFNPVGSAVRIAISRTDSDLVSGFPNGIRNLQGNYSCIDCRTQALPENIEQAIDQLLLDRVHQIENKMGATHGQIHDILKEVRC